MVDTSNAVPEAYHAAGLDTKVLLAFGMDARTPKSRRWRASTSAYRNPEARYDCGRRQYTGLKDAYKSLIEALSREASQ